MNCRFANHKQVSLNRGAQHLVLLEFVEFNITHETDNLARGFAYVPQIGLSLFIMRHK